MEKGQKGKFLLPSLSFSFSFSFSPDFYQERQRKRGREKGREGEKSEIMMPRNGKGKRRKKMMNERKQFFLSLFIRTFSSKRTKEKKKRIMLSRFRSSLFSTSFSLLFLSLFFFLFSLTKGSERKKKVFYYHRKIFLLLPFQLVSNSSTFLFNPFRRERRELD